MSGPWGPVSRRGGRERGPGRGTAPTGDVDVVVGFQPGLGAQQVVLRHQEDDVFGPVDLPWGPAAGSAAPEAVAKPSLSRGSPRLTPEVGGQCQKQAHRLAVGRVGAAGHGEHQRLGAGGAGGPQDAVHVGARHHLQAGWAGRPQHHRPEVPRPRPDPQGAPWSRAPRPPVRSARGSHLERAASGRSSECRPPAPRPASSAPARPPAGPCAQTLR